MGTRYAAIDIGTVTCRLLVAEVDELGMHELAHGVKIVNLGEGVDATGVLKADAMERVRACVAGYLRTVARFEDAAHPVKVIAMATSASRDASNADEFIAMLADLGVTLTVIPGEREAGLSFKGASAAFPGEALLVTDVGGGSTELIAGVGGQEPLLVHSFNIGCRRVTERDLRSDPPTSGEIDTAKAWCHPQFAGFFEQLRRMGFAPQRMVSVAGTATTVVSVDQQMEVYDSARVNGTFVPVETLDAVTGRLAGMPLAERRRVVGLQPDRAPVIVAGMLILQDLVGLTGLGGFTVSEADILQGIIMDAAAAS